MQREGVSGRGKLQLQAGSHMRAAAAANQADGTAPAASRPIARRPATRAAVQACRPRSIGSARLSRGAAGPGLSRRSAAGCTGTARLAPAHPPRPAPPTPAPGPPLSRKSAHVVVEIKLRCKACI